MIKKFHTYIKENNDLVPYGEEVWNDNEDRIHEGDIVICIDDSGLDFPNKIKLGVDYEVISVHHNHINLKGLGGWWMMKRFKKDTYIKENVEDLDPYGEEWWSDEDIEKIGSIIRCTTTCTTEGIELSEGEEYEIINISPDEDGYFIEVRGKANLIKADFFKYYGKSKALDEFESDDKIIKYEGIIPIWWPKHIFINTGMIKENVEDLDPYGEEVWDKPDIDLNDPSLWEDGDIIICTNKEGGGGRRLEIGKEYTIFDITKPSGDAVWVKGDNTYYSTRYFKLKK